MAIINHQRSATRVFVSFADSDAEFADYLEYVLGLRGFEPVLHRGAAGPSNLISECDAGVLILSDASAVSSRCESEVAGLRRLGKRIAVISVSTLSPDTSVLPAIAAEPVIHCWRNPDVADSSLVNGLILLEDKLQGAPDIASKATAPLVRALAGLRRRSVAQIAVLTAFLLCAAGASPWVFSWVASARTAAAEDRNHRAVLAAPRVAPPPPVRPAPVRAAAVRKTEAPLEIVYITALPPELPGERIAPETIAPIVEAEPAPAVSPIETATIKAAPAPALSDAERLAKQDETDWLAARQTGTLSAYRNYIELHAEGVHAEEAMTRARRRINALSTTPDTTLVYLTQPATFRGLPTFDVDGVQAGDKGQDVYIIDRISTPREGEWLVFERGGAWPFLFVAAPEIDGRK